MEKRAIYRDEHDSAHLLRALLGIQDKDQPLLVENPLEQQDSEGDADVPVIGPASERRIVNADMELVAKQVKWQQRFLLDYLMARQRAGTNLALHPTEINYFRDLSKQFNIKLVENKDPAGKGGELVAIRFEPLPPKPPLKERVIRCLGGWSSWLRAHPISGTAK